jgi:hypothetical protein
MSGKIIKLTFTNSRLIFTKFKNPKNYDGRNAQVEFDYRAKN